MPFSISTENDKLIAIDAQGVLSAENIEEGLERLLDLTQQHEDAGILIRMSHMDLGALMKVARDIARRPEYLELKGRAGRAAILTNQAWIRNSATIETSVMPRLDAKVFDLSEEVDARVWLDEKPELVDAA